MTPDHVPTNAKTEKGNLMSNNGTDVRSSTEPGVASGDSGPEATEPTVDGSDAGPAKDDTGTVDEGAGAAEDDTAAKSSRSQLSISFTVRGLVMAAVIAVLVAAVGALGWMYLDARHQLDTQATQASNDARAEKTALDYAVNAATMNFKDLQSWHVKLVAGTSPELNKKLSDAGKSMEQVLVPLEWSSTAQPLVAKVRSSTGGIYVVDSFVSVQTKTIQAPEPLQSTATYSTTIDSNDNWQITDVGGLGSALGPK